MPASCSLLAIKKMLPSSAWSRLAATIERIQDMMREAGFFRGSADGKMNAELQEAIGLCIRNDACVEQASMQMSDIVEAY